MRITTKALVFLIGVLLPANASAQLISEDAFIDKVNECIAQSEMDEFDDVDSSLERMAEPCALSGTFRRTAPTLPGLGHIIKYDPATRKFDYVVVPDVQSTIRYGGGISPYAKLFPPMQRKALEKSLRKSLETLGNQSFWYLPLIAKNDVSDTYTATNAYGAKAVVSRHRGDRFDLIVPVDWRAGRPELVASFPLEQEKARDVAEHLLLEIDFKLERACATCFTGDTAKFGTLSTTITSPYDIELTHMGAYAKISEFRLIDGRTDEVLGRASFPK